MCKKLSKSRGISRKLSNILPGHTLKKIYLPLVYPHLVYCVDVWGGVSDAVLALHCSLQDRIIVRLVRGDSNDILGLTTVRCH